MGGAASSRHPSGVLPQAALDLAALRTGPFRHTPPPASRKPVGSRARGRVLVVLLAVAISGLLLQLTAATTLGATTVTPKCDAVNLRTGPSTGYLRKGSVNEGAKLTVVATVTGGSYATSCAGVSLTGTTWHKVSSIDGRSVSSLYGVTYVYGAAKLFRTVTTPTPSPTAVPTPAPATAAPTAAPTPAPSAGPSAAPTAAPTTDPGASPDPSPAPSATPAPTTAPTASPVPTPVPTANPVTLTANVTFFGRGWGHGVGLSQYGAHGRALEGQTAQQILAHYYRNTVLGTMPNSQIRVLVLQTFQASSANPVQVFGRGGSWTIDGIAKTFPADARLKFVPATSGGVTTWKAVVTALDGTTLHSAAAPSSIRVRGAANGALQLWSKPSAYDRYRGVLRLVGTTGATSTVNVVNELPIESYLRGVVPAEVSASWPIEAIKAQAVAARSYAAYRLHPNTGVWDAYDDTRSQVYLGKLAEKANSTAAITATSGVVVRTGGGAIANTLFHSAAGGATEHNENVYVSSTGQKVAGVYSYLRGVRDRRADGTAYDSASPYATWKTKTYTLAQLQAWFASDARTNVGTLVRLDLRDRGVSGRLISVTLIGANGTTKKVSGDVFRSIFNAKKPAGDPILRSTLFDLIPVP
jgi:SpoIID/LytB domain protein